MKRFDSSASIAQPPAKASSAEPEMTCSAAPPKTPSGQHDRSHEAGCERTADDPPDGFPWGFVEDGDRLTVGGDGCGGRLDR